MKILLGRGSGGLGDRRTGLLHVRVERGVTARLAGSAARFHKWEPGCRGGERAGRRGAWGWGGPRGGATAGGTQAPGGTGPERGQGAGIAPGLGSRKCLPGFRRTPALAPGRTAFEWLKVLALSKDGSGSLQQTVSLKWLLTGLGYKHGFGSALEGAF